MDIYKLLREGMSAEELVEQFATALENAQTRIEKENKEAAVKAAEEAWAKERKAVAREDLGTALINFALANDWITECDEEILTLVDEYMDQCARLLFMGSMSKPIVYRWRSRL